MARKNKKLRKKRLAAAEAFVEAWTDSGLAYNLIPDYGCTLGCSEAKTYAGLLRAFGYENTADQILADHGEDCDNPHYHEPNNVWTFTLEAKGVNVEEDASWVIVADGKDGQEAEGRAWKYLTDQLQKEIEGYFWVRVIDVASGVPGSLALYSWTDIRKGK